MIGQSILNTVVEYKELSIVTLKSYVAKNEPKIKNFVDHAFNNNIVKLFIEPNLETIEYWTNRIKWTVELVEILYAMEVFGTIYDKLRWKIVDHTFCIWLGAVAKCDYGIHMSFLGLMVALYSISMSISMQIVQLPASMVFGELDLNAFRLGLWYATSHNLYYWFDKKINLKYALGRHRPRDRAEKMHYYDQMIGADTRYVILCWNRVLRLTLNLFIRIFGVYLDNVKKNLEYKRSKKNNN